MNLLAIQKRVYRRVKLADSPPTEDVTRILDFINLWHREILAMPGMERFRDTVLTFATVANQKQYGLPQAISRIRSIFDLTNQRRIQPRSVDWLRNVDPGLTATASFTEFWIPLNGLSAVQMLPSTAGTGLWVASSGIGDTTQKVYVETTRVGGYRGGLAVGAGTALNGLTRVQVGTATDHLEIVKFYSDTVPAGYIQLFDAATLGNTLSNISPGRTQARYFMIQLYPTPGAAVTLSVDCQRALEDLTLPTEEPLLHEDFHQVLVHAAAYEEWLNRGDVRAKDEYARLMKVISDMRQYVDTNPDEIAVQRGPRGSAERVSRLGGYFPSGT